MRLTKYDLLKDFMIGLHNLNYGIAVTTMVMKLTGTSIPRIPNL